MKNHYLLSLDPGESSGIALGIFADDQPYELIETWQPRGGAVGFLQWWRSDVLYKTMGVWDKQQDIIVSELFTLRNNAFVANVEPVRIEGVMLALGIEPVWQRPFMKKLVADEILVEHGLWQTGKKFGHVDGRDANDSIVHSLAYLKSNRHRPTLRKFW